MDDYIVINSTLRQRNKYPSSTDFSIHREINAPMEDTADNPPFIHVVNSNYNTTIEPSYYYFSYNGIIISPLSTVSTNRFIISFSDSISDPQLLVGLVFEYQLQRATITSITSIGTDYEII